MSTRTSTCLPTTQCRLARTKKKLQKDASLADEKGAKSICSNRKEENHPPHHPPKKKCNIWLAAKNINLGKKMLIIGLRTVIWNISLMQNDKEIPYILVYEEKFKDNMRKMFTG